MSGNGCQLVMKRLCRGFSSFWMIVIEAFDGMDLLSCAQFFVAHWEMPRSRVRCNCWIKQSKIVRLICESAPS